MLILCKMVAKAADSSFLCTFHAKITSFCVKSTYHHNYQKLKKWIPLWITILPTGQYRALPMLFFLCLHGIKGLLRNVNINLVGKKKSLEVLGGYKMGNKGKNCAINNESECISCWMCNWMITTSNEYYYYQKNQFAF